MKFRLVANEEEWDFVKETRRPVGLWSNERDAAGAQDGVIPCQDNNCPRAREADAAFYEQDLWHPPM
eukprot:4320215-Lingulodinium_polyedra.AAC.1